MSAAEQFCVSHPVEPMPNLLQPVKHPPVVPSYPTARRPIGFWVQPTLQLGLLWLAYSEVGWLLSAYHAPKLVWVGTLTMTFYLAWAGTNAIVLSTIWVVAVLSVSAIRHAWMWHVPRPVYQVEPFTLLVIWLLSLGLIGLTALVHKKLRYRCDRAQVLYRITLAIWFGLTCGLLMYDYLTFPLLSP